MVYFKLMGKEVEAKTFDPYCTYYCKDAEGNEWEIKRTPLDWTLTPGKWTAAFKGKIVTADLVEKCVEIVQLVTEFHQRSQKQLAKNNSQGETH
jgi:hypothetical protein